MTLVYATLSLCNRLKCIDTPKGINSNNKCCLNKPQTPVTSNQKKCPECLKIYTPDFPSRDLAVMANGTAIQKEQHQTGICSEQCWNAFLGI